MGHLYNCQAQGLVVFFYTDVHSCVAHCYLLCAIVSCDLTVIWTDDQALFCNKRGETQDLVAPESNRISMSIYDALPRTNILSLLFNAGQGKQLCTNMTDKSTDAGWYTYW